MEWDFCELLRLASWNINGTENGGSLLGAEDSGKGEFAPLKKNTSPLKVIPSAGVMMMMMMIRRG